MFAIARHVLNVRPASQLCGFENLGKTGHSLRKEFVLTVLVCAQLLQICELVLVLCAHCIVRGHHVHLLFPHDVHVLLKAGQGCNNVLRGSEHSS